MTPLGILQLDASEVHRRIVSFPWALWASVALSLCVLVAFESCLCSEHNIVGFLLDKKAYDGSSKAYYSP